MTEYHFLQMTSDKIDENLLNNLGFIFKTYEHDGGYEIYTKDGNSVIRGFYHDRKIQSICPSKCNGDYKSILKVIDNKVPIQIYSDNFMYYMCHQDYDEQKNHEAWRNEIDTNRNMFGLKSLNSDKNI